MNFETFRLTVRAIAKIDALVPGPDVPGNPDGVWKITLTGREWRALCDFVAETSVQRISPGERHDDG